MRKYFLWTLLGTVLITAACNKELEREPFDSLSTEKALSTLKGIQAATAGMYANLRSASYYGRSLFIYGDVSADDVYIAKTNSNRYISTYQRNYAAVDADILAIWTQIYSTVARANNIINAVDKVQGTDEEKNLLKGQALFVRALCYFDLVRIFAKPYNQGGGDQSGVPLVLVSDVNAYPARNTVEEVYNQVITDLQSAKNLLSSTTENDKFTASKYAASALLSRVFLYKEDYVQAAEEATLVINAGYTLTSEAGIAGFYSDGGFDEEIFTVRFLSFEDPGSANIGNFYLKPGYGDARVSPDLVTIFDQANDLRFRYFIGPFTGSPQEFQNNKYEGQGGVQGLHSPKVLRLAEIVLNRAEARVNSDEDNAALNDLNAIRNARGLPALNGISGDALLEEILLERRRELMFEGHRFFDLLRNGRAIVRNYCNEATQVSSVQCTLPTTDPKAIAPIPQGELDANPAIRGQQNPGY